MSKALLTFEIREVSPLYAEQAKTLRSLLESTLETMQWTRTVPRIHTTYTIVATGLEPQTSLTAAIMASRRALNVNAAMVRVDYALLVSESSPLTGSL